MKTSTLRRSPGVKGKPDSVASQIVPEKSNSGMAITKIDQTDIKTGTITRLKGVPLRADVDYSQKSKPVPTTRTLKKSSGGGYKSTTKKKGSYY